MYNGIEKACNNMSIKGKTGHFRINLSTNMIMNITMIN